MISVCPRTKIDTYVNEEAQLKNSTKTSIIQLIHLKTIQFVNNKKIYSNK